MAGLKSEALRARLAEVAPIWGAGLAIGVRTALREPLLGMKRIVLPVSYWRATEFAFVHRVLALPPGSRLLDLGSPKDLAAMLVRKRGYEIIATDILPAAVELSRRYARAQGLDGFGPGRVHSELQDGRNLTFPDDSFDAAFTVSVLEHIPDEGDSAAVRQLVRVVRPGGCIVGTVPYDRSYRETFVARDVYERQRTGHAPVFFERHYDDAALRSRLFEPAGAQVETVERWGEGRVRGERLLSRLGRAERLLSPLHPLLSAALLRRVDSPDAGCSMAAFFVLRKPKAV